MSDTSSPPLLPLLAEPELDTHLGFIFAEEDALKAHLSQITVPVRPDSSERQKVGVWFRWPEGERQIKYPFITIDLLSAEPAFDLFHSEHEWPAEDLYRPDFSPSIPPPPEGWGKQSYTVRNYLPFRLIWQVTHHARSSLHDRYLTSIFITDVFPVRPFFIHVPADDTWRRTENVTMAAANTQETTESGTKRIFRKYYTISMLAEVPQDKLANSVVYKTLRVYIPVVALEQFDSFFHNVIKNHPDPIGEFTEEERAIEGEYFHIVHEGQEIPPAT